MSLATTTASRETLWASDTTADLLEELQYTLNEGACIEAATTGAAVLVPDLLDTTDTARWPAFADAVLDRTPVRALFALPLQWGPNNLGVVDLYRDSPGGLDQQQWQDALNVAQLGSGLMLGIRTAPAPDPRNDRVHDATDWPDPYAGNHHQVQQATGMVLTQLEVSSTEALARMRAHAYAHDRLLIEIARDVVNHQLVFTNNLHHHDDTNDHDKNDAKNDDDVGGSPG